MAPSAASTLAATTRTCPTPCATRPRDLLLFSRATPTRAQRGWAVPGRNVLRPVAAATRPVPSPASTSAARCIPTLFALLRRLDLQPHSAATLTRARCSALLHFIAAAPRASWFFCLVRSVPWRQRSDCGLVGMMLEFVVGSRSCVFSSLRERENSDCKLTTS
jgi:hypothetical protein